MFLPIMYIFDGQCAFMATILLPGSSLPPGSTCLQRKPFSRSEKGEATREAQRAQQQFFESRRRSGRALEAMAVGCKPCLTLFSPGPAAAKRQPSGAFFEMGHNVRQCKPTSTYKLRHCILSFSITAFALATCVGRFVKFGMEFV